LKLNRNPRDRDDDQLLIPTMLAAASSVDSIQQVFEPVESVPPEGAIGFHPVNEGSEPVGDGSIVRLPSLRAIDNESRGLEYSEMLGHRRLRNTGMVRQGTDGLLPFTDQPLINRAAAWIAEGTEDMVRSDLHGKTITPELSLFKCELTQRSTSHKAWLANQRQDDSTDTQSLQLGRSRDGIGL